MPPSQKLETWGNETTMNMGAILHQNILASPYFKSLYDKKTYHEVIDEIYYQVTNLNPFLKGTTPSTAFCLLYKFWTMRLSIKQIEGLIDHVDSPYIRGVGFLYLRYVCKPDQLWDWLGPYIDDEEELDLSGGVKPVKRMFLLEQKFQGEMLPRIPVPIARKIEQNIKDWDRENNPGMASKHSNGGRRSSKYDNRSRSPRDDYPSSRKHDDKRSSSYYHSDGKRRYSRSRSRSPHSRSRQEEDEFDDYKRHSGHDRRDRDYRRDRNHDRDREYRGHHDEPRYGRDVDRHDRRDERVDYRSEKTQSVSQF
ncbi:hypothetical protein BZG36_00051 [Bifiguratus adelaidae]|uniref:Pre-mRNA-splicing factor 38 n=1 Tax=Bifiguratus adelaidae TaxID=1938954 RepID=A0A261Y8L5_9FUNG|nr:hypothetical protein BZG36_00051 [Bifiguratus adelaidae]